LDSVKKGKKVEGTTVLAVPVAPLGASSAAAARPPPAPPGPQAGYLGLLRNVRGPLCPGHVEAPTHYVVSRNPHNPCLRGLWSGEKSATWAKVTGTLRGGKLFGSGAKVKRVANLTEAEVVWAAACAEPMVQWVVEA